MDAVDDRKHLMWKLLWFALLFVFEVLIFLHACSTSVSFCLYYWFHLTLSHPEPNFPSHTQTCTRTNKHQILRNAYRGGVLCVHCLRLHHQNRWSPSFLSVLPPYLAILLSFVPSFFLSFFPFFSSFFLYFLWLFASSVYTYHCDVWYRTMTYHSHASLRDNTILMSPLACLPTYLPVCVSVRLLILF